jgi:hypothetical protein
MTDKGLYLTGFCHTKHPARLPDFSQVQVNVSYGKNISSAIPSASLLKLTRKMNRAG